MHSNEQHDVGIFDDGLGHWVADCGDCEWQSDEMDSQSDAADLAWFHIISVDS
jgi:hypothetical protein